MSKQRLGGFDYGREYHQKNSKKEKEKGAEWVLIVFYSFIFSIENFEKLNPSQYLMHNNYI
jgi:hypothetical protein